MISAATGASAALSEGRSGVASDEAARTTRDRSRRVVPPRRASVAPPNERGIRTARTAERRGGIARKPATDPAARHTAVMVRACECVLE